MRDVESLRSFWRGKRVFVTSPTSFLGAWLSLSLIHLGAQVFGLAESSESAPSPTLFDLSNLAQNISMTYGDLCDEDTVREGLQFAQADIVFHLGEWGLFREAEKKALDVFSKSVVSSALLMELLRETASIRSVVIVSSDKVYSRDRENKPFEESSLVGAQEILPTAKLCSELIALSYRHTFFNPEKYNKHKVAIATARIGQGLGGGDFSPSSLIPQAVQSFRSQSLLELRNPHSIRPWIHVLDQVSGLLILAEALFVKGPKLAPTYNLGAQEFETVSEVLKEFLQFLSSAQEQNVLPVLADAKKLSIHGQLNSQLAEQDLGWSPRWSLSQSLEDTAQWFHESERGEYSKTLFRYFGF